MMHSESAVSESDASTIHASNATMTTMTTTTNGATTDGSTDGTTATATTTTTTTIESPEAKISKDLSALEEQIDLCRTMLRAEADVGSNDALLAVVGFLEACVPRMLELIEAGAQGALDESSLERCLLVNDRLAATLDDVDIDDPSERKTTKLVPSSGSGGAAAAAGGGSSGGAAARARTDVEKEFDDLLAGGSSDSPPASPSKMGEGGVGAAGVGKSTGEEDDEKGTAATAADPFAGPVDVLSPTPAMDAGTKKDADNDFDAEFDAFLKERASGDDK